jgi:Uma2 family endonuclease
MSTAARSRLYTPDELEEMDDPVAYELEDGELVERDLGSESSEIGMTIGAALVQHSHGSKLGRVLGSDVGLRIWPDRPKNYRRPDVAFVQRGRLPGGTPKGYLTIPPDLIVEVISPHEMAVMIERKVREYLAAGVRLIWVIYPDTRTAQVFRLNGTSMPVAPEGTLDGEDVVPGFAVPLAAVFLDLDDE